MMHYLRCSILLIVVLLAAGCVMPASVQPPSGSVVQGSTAAPTEPPTVETSAGETPAAEQSATETPAPITIVETPILADTPTSLPPAEPTAGPTAPPTEEPTSQPTPSPGTPTPTTPSPTKTPYPTGIFVASSRGFTSGSGYVVVGEVLNTAKIPIFGAKIIANFYDSKDALIGAQQALTSFAMTEPEVGNPFRLQIENLVSAVARYELTVTWEDVSLIEFRPLAVLDQEVGQGEVVGQIRNDQESSLTSIVVAVIFYDAAGQVVDTADIFLGGQILAPNATMPFAIPIHGDTPAYDHFWIEAQGNVNLF